MRVELVLLQDAQNFVVAPMIQHVGNIRHVFRVKVVDARLLHDAIECLLRLFAAVLLVLHRCRVLLTHDGFHFPFVLVIQIVQPFSLRYVRIFITV
ncbi:hypothetical protein SDC9_155179 [bioreactor metagenome]|uniref:Uncharacterized protein n=1 Tax=bioreactor metagenome TaxID=1076179 RepID=A0A645F134_9ZZZZ